MKLRIDVHLANNYNNEIRAAAYMKCSPIKKTAGERRSSPLVLSFAKTFCEELSSTLLPSEEDNLGSPKSVVQQLHREDLGSSQSIVQQLHEKCMRMSISHKKD
jgi:hypothetical protein